MPKPKKQPVSEKKRLANQRNAQKSTGPKTPEGKARSKLNALLHGFFCQEVIILKEDQPLYKALRREMIHDLKPQKLIELGMVDKIVECYWKMRRLRVSEAQESESELRAKLKEDGDTYEAEMKRNHYPDYCVPTAMGRMMDREFSGLEHYSRMEQRLQNMVHRCLKELRMLREEQAKLDALPPSPFEETVEQVEYQLPPDPAEGEEAEQQEGDAAAIKGSDPFMTVQAKGSEHESTERSQVHSHASPSPQPSPSEGEGVKDAPTDDAKVRNEANDVRRYDGDTTCAPDHIWFTPPPQDRYTSQRAPEPT